MMISERVDLSSWALRLFNSAEVSAVNIAIILPSSDDVKFIKVASVAAAS